MTDVYERRRPGRMSSAAVGAAIALGALAGCSASSTDTPTSGATSTVATSESASSSPSSDSAASTSEMTAPTLPEGVTQNTLPDPTAITNVVDLRQFVEMTGCAKIDGGWSASGTAINSGTNEVTYHVTIFFTTATATTLDSAEVDVTVQPGETGTWTAEKQFTAPDPTLCVLRGVG